MKSIKVESLRPGLRFDKPVYVDGENLLVPANVEITQRDIERLLKWQIRTVTTDGKPMIQLPSAGKNSLVQQTFSSPEHQKTMDAYSKLAAEVQDIFERVRGQQPVKSVEADDLVDRLLRLLGERRETVIELILYGLQGEAGFIENALNCAVIVTMVGQKLNMVQHKLLQLATAGLLHDVGMLRLPPSLRTKSGELTPDELATIHQHPVHSYRIITREMRFAEEVGIAALQHQERWDGQGYPRRISGREIGLPARVVAVADAFEAMVSKRPYRSPMIGYQAMRAILGDNARRFDPDVIKVFIATMGIYPIGSIVQLSDASIGRVLDVNSSAPVRPRVKIMIDRHGREFPRDGGDVVDLAAEGVKLYIARAVDPRELAAAPAS